MPAYAIAHLHAVEMSPEISTYLHRIDATLRPHQGRFLVHGSPVDVREGPFNGDVIVIEFPDRQAADNWYRSAPYQEILPLRTSNSKGWVIIVDGVTPNHRGADILAQPPA